MKKTVELELPCAMWQGEYTPYGYGRCHAKWFGKYIKTAHRLAWIDHHGMLPPADRPFILHHCDNSWCVEPTHLYAGTAENNRHDRQGRHEGNRWQTWADVLKVIG